MARLLAANGRFAAVPFLATLGLFGFSAAHAQTVDGTRDASYPAALAVQGNATQFGNSNTGLQTNANGSELDNVHAKVVGTDLYLFFGGNLQSNFNKLELFFDSKTGGQNVLRNDNPDVDSNGLNAMAGLKFDAGFESDYYVMITTGDNQVYVNVAETPTGGGGAGKYSGGGTGRTFAVNYTPLNGQDNGGDVSFDNSNTGGVSDTDVNDPSTVSTGFELRIPLASFGITSGSGSIALCSFINGSDHKFLSNQVLGSLPANTGNLGGPGGVDFSSIAGNQYVPIAYSIAAPSAPVLSVSPTALNFNNVAQGTSATRTLTLTNTGTGTLNVTGITSTNSAFTVSPGTASLAANASTTITVTLATGTAGSQSGTLNIASNGGSSSVAVSGKVIATGQVVIDGTADTGLYTQKAVQTSPTQFGNNLSELDAAYVRVTSTDLYVTISGNLESNQNKLLLFFDANPNTGQSTIASNNPTVDSGQTGNLAGITFDRGFKPESFIGLAQNGSQVFANFVPLNGAGGDGTYLSAGSQAFTQPLDFGGGVMGELSFDNSNMAGVTDTQTSGAGAVKTGVELRIPLSALGSGITSTTPIHVMAMLTSPKYDYLSNQTLGGLPNINSNLGTDGAGGSTLPFTVDFGKYATNQFFTAQRGDVSFNDTRAIAGDYRNITVGSGGVAQVYSPLDVTGTLQATGTLAFQVPGDANAPEDAYVSGSGSTVVTSALSISSADGITQAAATGNVRTSSRSFSASADYTYLGGAQTSGSGLTAARNLTKTTTGALTLNSPVSVSQVVAATGANIVSGGNLTLLSSASGTALAVNGAGNVTGAIKAQRYIGGIGGPGYRMLASPVTTSVANLTTGGGALEISRSADYNVAAMPGTITPFPNLFVYDQSRAGTITSDLSAFNQGFLAVEGAGRALNPGDGVDFNTRGNQTITFSGQNNNAAFNATLANGGGASQGWALLGNPFAAPFSWDDITLNNIDRTLYVSQATGQYSGTYSAYNPSARLQATPTSENRVPLGQAFFIHASSGGGSISIPATARITTFDASLHPVQRQAADSRTALRLALSGTADQEPDYTAVYFDERATADFEGTYDAYKLFNTGGNLNLYTTAKGSSLALNALPLPGTSAVVVPVEVRVPAAGTYALALHELVDLPAGSTLELRDALTGTNTVLSEGTSYSFTTAGTTATGRFTLVLNAAAAPLATAGQALAAQIGLYPNPAHGQFRLELPLLSAAQVQAGVHAELLNVLGQVVRQVPLHAVAGQALQTDVNVADLGAGIYQLRLTVGDTQAVRRVVVE